MRRRYPSIVRLAAGLALAVAACAVVPGKEAVRHGTAADGRTLILISFDGCRWDYPDWPEAANLRRLAARGLRAEGLIPPFPSKTFPSHYTIVTGLAPGRHGMISNHMRDPQLGEFHLDDRAAVEDSRWWGGEPIWVTAAKAGFRTAAMFWPGTEAEIAGVRPDFWNRWDSSFPYAERVERVLAWLDLPAAERPHLITLYFQDPNDTSHRFGPLAAETRAALREVDSRLGDLLAGIAVRGLEGTVDLVVVSDHGMAAVAPERTIDLGRLHRFEPGELFEQGALVQIFPHAGREAAIYAALSGAHPNLAVYRRDEIPPRYGLAASHRTAPIIGVPDVGWRALAKPPVGDGFELRGDHGQDPGDPRMHGILIAAGPSFRRGTTRGRVAAVEIYGLLASVLGVSPAANEGQPGFWDGVLVR